MSSRESSFEAPCVTFFKETISRKHLLLSYKFSKASLIFLIFSSKISYNTKRDFIIYILCSRYKRVSVTYNYNNGIHI